MTLKELNDFVNKSGLKPEDIELEIVTGGDYGASEAVESHEILIGESDGKVSYHLLLHVY